MLPYCWRPETEPLLLRILALWSAWIVLSAVKLLMLGYHQHVGLTAKFARESSKEINLAELDALLILLAAVRQGWVGLALPQSRCLLTRVLQVTDATHRPMHTQQQGSFLW